MANGSLQSVSQASLSANATISANTDSAKNAFGAISGGATEDADSKLRNAIQLATSVGVDGKFGMNPNKIPEMQAAIKTYINKLLDDEHLGGLKSVDASTAFGQSIGEALKNFTSTVYNSVEILTKNLEAFNKDLDGVKAAYDAKTQSVSTNVADTSSTLSSTASGWSYSSGGSN